MYFKPHNAWFFSPALCMWSAASEPKHTSTIECGCVLSAHAAFATFNCSIKLMSERSSTAGLLLAADLTAFLFPSSHKLTQNVHLQLPQGTRSSRQITSQVHHVGSSHATSTMGFNGELEQINSVCSNLRGVPAGWVWYDKTIQMVTVKLTKESWFIFKCLSFDWKKITSKHLYCFSYWTPPSCCF